MLLPFKPFCLLVILTIPKYQKSHPHFINEKLWNSNKSSKIMQLKDNIQTPGQRPLQWRVLPEDVPCLVHCFTWDDYRFIPKLMLKILGHSSYWDSSAKSTWGTSLCRDFNRHVSECRLFCLLEISKPEMCSAEDSSCMQGHLCLLSLGLPALPLRSKQVIRSSVCPGLEEVLQGSIVKENFWKTRIPSVIYKCS